MAETGFYKSKKSNYDTGYANKFDFYSGSQITIWFGDIMLDDVSSIQWVRQQNKKPIYGYASQQFDAVAKGTVIVQGNFVINFRQRGYLVAVVDSIKKLYKQYTGDAEEDSLEVTENSRWKEVRKLVGLHLRQGTFGPTTAQEIKDIGDSPEFFRIAKAYEDIIWGYPNVNDSGEKILGATDVAQHLFIPGGLSILVTYGNISGSDQGTLNGQFQSTSKSIVGVHLTGESQVIQVGGQPVMEQYEFIARGTDENISSG